MIRKNLPVLIYAFLTSTGTAHANEPDIFNRLQKEPVTLFDVGIKRLRGAALAATNRLVPSTEPKPTQRVTFDEAKRRVVVRFDIRLRSASASMIQCWERRAAAIKETFSIGKTRYVVPMTVEERIRRRIGTMFSSEPSDPRRVFALGGRLSELTQVEMHLTGAGHNTPVACRGIATTVKAPGQNRK